MTPEVAIIQANVNYFFTAANIFAVALTLQILDIHWIYMGSQLSLFCIVQSALVFFRFPNIFVDYIIVCILVNSILLFANFKTMKVAKLSFLKSKKIQSLLKE